MKQETEVKEMVERMKLLLFSFVLTCSHQQAEERHCPDCESSCHLSYIFTGSGFCGLCFGFLHELVYWEGKGCSGDWWVSPWGKI